MKTYRHFPNGCVKKPTLPEIKRIIKKAHPDMTGLKVTWVKRPFWLHEPEKAPFAGWWGLVKLEADGYAPTIKTATADETVEYGKLYLGNW